MKVEDLMTPRQHGVEAGYAIGGGLPPCPYPLRDRDRRDAWFDGWHKGVALHEQHDAELTALIEREE